MSHKSIRHVYIGYKSIEMVTSKGMTATVELWRGVAWNAESEDGHGGTERKRRRAVALTCESNLPLKPNIDATYRLR